MNDYIILVDETGQPYIAHSWGNRWKNYKAKYIYKLQTSPGKYRYFYTQDEYKGYLASKLKSKLPALDKKKYRKDDTTKSNEYNRPTSHQKNVTGTAKEGWSKRRESADVSTKAKYGEYNRNDPDFSDANYKRAKNIGDTDFSTFKRDDGRWVILEEDMKWVLPKGVSGNSPEIRKAIKKFSDRVESARAINNYAYTHDEWLSAVNEAINDASRKAKNKY